MALRVAYPPTPSHLLPSQPTMSAVGEPSGYFPTVSYGGFEPYFPTVKTEPRSSQGPSSSPLPSFLHPPPPFSPLSSANFSHFSKHGNTDMYPRGGGTGTGSGGGTSSLTEEDVEEELTSWTYKHPDHWDSKEVLDWVFSLTDEEGFEGALFRGEAYNTLTGRQLRDMSVAEFLALDSHYGARVHDVFNDMLEGADFKQPFPPETFQSEYFHGNMPQFHFLSGPDDVTPQQPPPQLSSAPSMSVYVDRHGREMTVSLDGLGLYDIDVDFTSITSKDTDHHSPSHPHGHHRSVEDSDYHSGSEGGAELRPRSASSSDVFQSLVSDREKVEGEGVRDMMVTGEGGDDMVGSGKPHLSSSSTSTSSSSSSSPSVSCDSGYEGDDEKTPVRKRQQSSSKGNHLWEFIRDLLHNPVFNPSLVRWEDKGLGVFKFVQSEAVAKLWGRKKNNPQMTYEKLSRAMRFCRSAGYFESVPKTGRFPKKLCFKFGLKAHGWLD